MPWWGWLLLVVWVPASAGLALLLAGTIRLRDRQGPPRARRAPQASPIRHRRRHHDDAA